MTLQYWALGVRAEATAVLAAMGRWKHASGPVRRGPQVDGYYAEKRWRDRMIDFAVVSDDPWTHTCFLSHPPIPALVEHISRDLATRAISAYAEERIGFEHFAVVDAGAVAQLLTVHDDDEDIVAVDCVELYESERSRNPKRPPPPHDPEELASEARHDAFSILVRRADVDVYNRWWSDHILTTASVHGLPTDGADRHCMRHDGTFRTWAELAECAR